MKKTNREKNSREVVFTIHKIIVRAERSYISTDIRRSYMNKFLGALFVLVIIAVMDDYFPVILSILYGSVIQNMVFLSVGNGEVGIWNVAVL